MTTIAILQWAFWAGALLAGVGAVLALIKLRYAERFLPEWNELQTIAPQLTARQEELRQLTEGVQLRQQEVGQLEATVGHLRILKEWQDANPDAPARIQQMMVDLERSKSELAAIQQKLAQDEAKLAQIAQEAQRLSQEKSQISEQLPSLRDQLTGLQRQTADLEKALRSLDDQRRQAELRLENLKRDIQSQETQLGALQQKVQKAEQEKALAIRERDQARADRDAAHAELTAHQHAIESLKAIAKGLEADLAKTPAFAGAHYADLFAPVKFPTLAPAHGHPDERAMLERTRDYIRGRGLVFPQRVLHAFHASLKCNDISPLVVLAGISGTGKSELPRHYADGMGLHFLLMSVQPRWDSPQDLFGFYNYLEKRYKATELARAMVQFERYNQYNWELPDGAEIDTREDRMLLVLLDEMNLARTEYYFSEFLSKLETRRMVDEEDDADRSRAEIELDMGSLLDGGKSLRLYPGRNVLFVGTMNEDESTQALSDKVIDRASVLRFWRPKKTNPDPGQPHHAAPTEGLTVEQWTSWVRPSTDLGEHAADVESWIEQINDALTRLGRPFAFRVDQAIRSYVANYPRWVDRWHSRAMSDQIQQRIFPKLRGVEPDLAQDALEAISKVIDQLDDEPLRTAFHESRENQSTFLFRGVIRDEHE